MLTRRFIEARLTAKAIDRNRLAGIERELSRHIRLVSADAPNCPRSGPVRLHLTAKRLRGPIVVAPHRGVAVSTRNIAGVCLYAGIDERTYLLICSLVGMSHWRVLASNPLLRPEDLLHPRGVHCVYHDVREMGDIALLLDSPQVCGGCTDFFHCLGADSELLALRSVLAELPAERRPVLEKTDLSGNATEESQEFDSDFREW